MATFRDWGRWADHLEPEELGITPLHQAVYQGNTKRVLELMQAGADINALDKYGWTPLHDAVFKKRIRITKLLIKQGAHINSQDFEEQWTPLHEAAFNGYTRLAEILLEAGADSTIKDLFGDTPLEDAQEKDYPEIVKLIKKARVKNDLVQAKKRRAIRK